MRGAAGSASRAWSRSSSPSGELRPRGRAARVLERRPVPVARSEAPFASRSEARRLHPRPVESGALHSLWSRPGTWMLGRTSPGLQDEPEYLCGPSEGANRQLWSVTLRISPMIPILYPSLVPPGNWPSNPSDGATPLMSTTGLPICPTDALLVQQYVLHAARASTTRRSLGDPVAIPGGNRPGLLP